MSRATFSAIAGAALLAVPGVRGAEEEKSPEKTASALGLLRQIDEAFVAVFEKVAPAVVVIEAAKRAEEDDDRDELKSFDFFSKETDEARTPGAPLLRLPTPVRSEGSGFIIRADGLILTNDHVISGAEKLSVRFKDGRVLPARLLASDDKTDIAVVKVEATALPVVQFGDSDKVRVGQLVCAIGAPFNQDYSFTCGWVSGKGRSNLLSSTSPTILYEDYIQTDAFINPGNSGGPLFDVEGQVVGMNTLINGIGRGLAFAIPSNMLREISDQLITGGKIQRPWLGIRILNLSENAALREHVTGIEKGVVVYTIQADAPAARSDLRAADVITEMDGAPLANTRDLQKEVLKKRVGQTVQLTVWRGGATLKIPVITGELPADVTRVLNAAPQRPPPEKSDGFGLKLRDGKGGVEVVAVLPDSPAARAEIQPEDVITEVETKPVADTAAAHAAISAADGKDRKKGILLNIERKGKRTFAVLEKHR